MEITEIDRQRTREIANTIINQLRGRRFLASVDPRLTIVEPDYENGVMGGVLIHIYHRQPKPIRRYFKVTLMFSDMYQVEAWNGKTKKRDEKKLEEVFFDQLIPLFERWTGYFII